MSEQQGTVDSISWMSICCWFMVLYSLLLYWLYMGYVVKLLSHPLGIYTQSSMSSYTSRYVISGWICLLKDTCDDLTYSIIVEMIQSCWETLCVCQPFCFNWVSMKDGHSWGCESVCDLTVWNMTTRCSCSQCVCVCVSACDVGS